MDLKQKILYVIDNYEVGDEIVISYTESTDNFVKVQKFPNNHIEFMNAYLKDYEEYGEVAGCDPKGIWYKYIDFELVKLSGGKTYGE